MRAKPVAVVAMMDGLADRAFTPEQWDRLDHLTALVREPLASFDRDDAVAVLKHAEILVGHWGCPTLTDAVLSHAPNLRLFAYAAGTVKWQVTEAVWQRPIVVTSAAAANAVPVAEFTLAMIVLANKAALLFREQTRDPSVRLPYPQPIGNAYKRVGLIGASFVGRAVIELLRPFALDVVVYDPYLSATEAAALGVERCDDLVALCASCDVVSLHAPDIEATRNMMRREHFRALRDGATFINTARPALIDQAALIEELESGRISAILDVTDPEPLPADHVLARLPNVFVTPHIAGSVGTELYRMADLAIDEVERYVRGEAPRFEVRRSDLDRIA